MQFQTQIPIATGQPLLDYNSRVVSLGSCFAENIARKLDHYQFVHVVNPFGILFQPLALAKAIDFAISEKVFTEKDIFFQHDGWHCFDAHSSLSSPDADTLLQRLNAAARQLRDGLQTATQLLVTLGTAWVYQHNGSGDYVANCHKVPQQKFGKKILSVAEIETALHRIVSSVQSQNPACQIVFTVSPVRHLKDGFVENQRSKAHLITALHSVLEQPHVSYFPAYEILMDELRDYRFYANDLLHPSALAIDYIWERFVQAWVDPSSQKVMDEVDSVRRGLAHRPFNPQSDAHQNFLKNLQKQMNSLQSRFPHMQFV